MGQGTQQRHHFSCRSCHEQIEVGLDVDYQNVSAVIFFGQNAVAADPFNVGDVVNLDANFLIPEEDQGKEMVFPRIEQSTALVRKIVEMRRAKGLPPFPEREGDLLGRRPDFAFEWNNCRAAWSLWRNGKDKLSKKRVEEASSTIYANDPLSDLQDWLWRFASTIIGPRYQALFVAGMKQIKQAQKNVDFPRFCEAFTDELSRPHGQIYFELMKAYFAEYDEFAQVQFFVTSGVDFPKAEASSSKFDNVKMFYGNAFEAFSSLVESLAYLNNLLDGRKFDEFQSMSRDQYLRLDKSSRFRCFETRNEFAEIARESDNTLRNASHHGGFVFEARSQNIRFRAGKGGQGEEMQISYTEYLRRCSEIFMQTMVLFSMELVLASGAKLRPPL